MLRQRRFTRIVLIALLLAIGGAIVNVAAMWFSVQMAGLPIGGSLPPPQHLASAPALGTIVTVNDSSWKWVVESGFMPAPSGPPLRICHERACTGLKETILAASPYDFQYGASLAIVEAGWPLLAFEGAVARTNTGVIYPLGVVYLDRYHPINPKLPGFAINTIFYAALFWMIFAFPFALRRRKRTRRGLCPACAYPIGTSDVCTECGTKLAVQAMANELSGT